MTQQHLINVSITQERPDTAAALALVDELQEFLAAHYLPENLLGFSVERLIEQGVAFFVLRVDGVPAACGGILLVESGDEGGDDESYGELKRMFVRPEFRGRGYARLMIDRLAEYAREHGIGLLRLETGIYQTDAIRLYEGVGFRRIEPFGDYVQSEINLCYERRTG